MHQFKKIANNAINKKIKLKRYFTEEIQMNLSTFTYAVLKLNSNQENENHNKILINSH